MLSANSGVDASTEKLVGYPETERATGLNGATLRWMVHEKRIPHIRLGPRIVRFRMSEIKAWLEEHACRPAARGGCAGTELAESVVETK